MMRFKILNYVIIWASLLRVVQTKKPSSKRQLSVWQLECKLGMITDPECPTDGGWSPWSAWSPCQGQCDDVGHRHRTRECINPPPSRDGAPCTGSDEQTEVCHLTNCTANDFRKLVIGDPARIQALRQLEAVPALMEQCLQIECPFEAIEAALSFDNTWQLNLESLWNALQCVKRNLGCLVTGEWSTWGSWSACGARCGRGLRWRLRRCDTPPPSDATLMCTGTPLQADECIGDQCAISSHDSGGSWGDWSSWSVCSEKCGPGVRRRRRICRETSTPHASGTWGTHCRGQYDQLEVCENPKCDLDGGWSGWGGWGPCSQYCGAGKQSRTRSCTRPIPAGNGKPCVGPRTEVGSCHLVPCEVFTHTVASFHGESSLHYDFANKRATFCQFYIRFMPLSSHGTLTRRLAANGAYVRLSLQKWHVCLDACGSSHSCCLPRLCSHTSIEQATWHSALVAITNDGAILRLDDAAVSLKSPWPCEPDLPDNNLHLHVGEKFQGQIQELILNFIPLKLRTNRDRRKAKTDFDPVVTSNIVYEKANTMEAYLRIKDDHYLRLPCFENQNEWKLELTLKPKKEVGTIIFLKSDDNKNWLHLDMQNMRLKLKLALGDFKSESISTIECPPDKWLDITIVKKQEVNAIEAAINAGERLHVLFEEEVAKRRRRYHKTNSHWIIDSENNSSIIVDGAFPLCTDEFFIGGIPREEKQHINEDFIPFSGVLASVRLNKAFIDLHDYSLERVKDDKLQVSSRTASVSGSYHETGWAKSKRLNLTCLHARLARSPHTARWLFLDTSLTGILREKILRSIDDGKVLKLIATADNDLRGFYTCRSHSNRRTVNVVTYGVLGRIQHKLHGPDTTTAIAVVTTLALVLGTLTWLFIEGIHDLRNGYGFYRDAHLSPEEEAEAVCRYIDQNMDLMSSKRVAQIAKANARRRGRQLAASQSNFAAQEPQGLMGANVEVVDRAENVPSEPEGLPTLPEVKSSGEVQDHQIYRLEPCYVSSPRHGSVTTPHAKVTSSSSFELVSPRVLCSKLHITKSSRSSGESKRKERLRPLSGRNRHSLLTIRSSSFLNPSPAQKILQKFQQLKSYDS
ncbi:uncharacterized protein LOC142986717 [Anticarsia gemmatalis]|uniref:uncharacterized protein LOC142986717 n=1 Tax=Anticarsia gemmatalis TaxID=129554 RepID=UPI003F7649C6